MKEHPEAYSAKADFRIDAVRLRDQITSRARTVLLVLLAASALVFIIACSNVANLILARTVRREGELAIRAALGASTGALRRTLLAESLLLCGAGAALGVLSARPMVAILARYAVALLGARARSDGRFQHAVGGRGAGGGRGGAAGVCSAPAVGRHVAWIRVWPAAALRITGGTNRRLRVFAVTQIAASFVLLAGASMLLKTLLALQAAQTGFDTRHVLAMNVPVMSYGQDAGSDRRLLQGSDPARSRSCRAWTASRWAPLFRGAMRATSVLGFDSRPTAMCARRAKKIRARGSASSRPDFSRRSAFRLSPDAISTTPIGEAASRW